MENGDSNGLSKQIGNVDYGDTIKRSTSELQISADPSYNNEFNVETSLKSENSEKVLTEKYLSDARVEQNCHNADTGSCTYIVNEKMNQNGSENEKSRGNLNGISSDLKDSNVSCSEMGENVKESLKDGKKKKKRRRHKKHDLECDRTTCHCSEERENERGTRKKKKRHLKRSSKNHGEENAEFVPDSLRGGTLWLGTELNDKNNTDVLNRRENKYLNNLDYEKKLEHSRGQTDRKVSNLHQNLFIASEFIRKIETTNTGADFKQCSQSSGKDSSNKHYKKNADIRGIKKKRRLGDLKRTSSKVSIVEPTPPVASRLDIEQTARTARTARDQAYRLKNPESETVPDFPKPLWFCKIITSFPVMSFLIVTLVHLGIIGATAGMVLSGYDVFPAVFDEVPLYIYNDARLKELAWRSRWSFEGAIYRPVYGYGTINTGFRSSVKDTVEVIFESPGANILTSEYLEWIKVAEDRLRYDHDYESHYCLLDHYYRCVKPHSILRLFDGTYSHVDAIFHDPNFENVTEVIYQASVYNETREFLDLFLGKDSVITPTRVHTSITRTVFVMGWPLSVINDRWGTLDHLTDFLADKFQPKIETIRDYLLVEVLDVYYISKIMYEHDLVEQALKDIMLAIGSVLFIFLFMCFQTGSIVLTSLGILSILSSYLLTNLFYRYVFQFKYFGFFHVISLFLILGIGADDLFVFYDTWRLTGNTKYPTNAHRLSDCYRRAAKTTFVTSLTTTVAFLVSGLSPLLPVKTFGIFTAVLVSVNYIWVIIYFPSIIMIHHTKTKRLWILFRRWLLALYLTPGDVKEDVTTKKATNVTVGETSSVSDTNSSRELLTKSKDSIDDKGDRFKPDSEDLNQTNKNGNHSNAERIASDDNGNGGNRDDKGSKKDDSIFYVDHDENRRNYYKRKLSKPKKNFEDRNKIVKFLRNTFFDFMTRRIVKIAFPLLFFAVSVFFIHRATMIEPDTQQLRLFRSNHNYAKATERHYNYFRRNHDDEYQRLYMVWGILPVDISHCDQKSAEYCFGKTRYDDNIDMNIKEAQIAFKDLCSNLENIPTNMIDKLRIQKHSSTQKPKIHCFTGDMERYYQKSFGDLLPSSINLSLPYNPVLVDALVDNFDYIYRYPLPDDFNNNFEILLSYWLTDGYNLRPTKDYFSYNELLVEKIVPGVTQHAFYTDSRLYYGGKLKYVAIEVNTTMNVYSLGYEQGLPIYEEWENFMKSINDKMPPPFKNGFQATANLWHWLHVQETLASSAITGIMVGLFTAWPVLVITTMNVVIGTIATFTIGLVTACVIGLIPLAGWKLGVLESINLCMVVGLSVDYIVHLAEAYRMSNSPKRLDRVHDMLEAIGLSVISGAITTMGAAVFMLFAKIQFFFQFGIFIISTVGIALIFSLFGFTTLLSLCGPENDTGHLPKLMKNIVKFCRKGDDEPDVDKDTTSSKSSIRCPCASPSVLVDRFYDCLSYRTHEQDDFHR